VQGAGFGVQGAGLRRLEIGGKTSGLESGVWGLGFRVKGIGFEV